MLWKLNDFFIESKQLSKSWKLSSSNITKLLALLYREKKLPLCQWWLIFTCLFHIFITCIAEENKQTLENSANMTLPYDSHLHGISNKFCGIKHLKKFSSEQHLRQTVTQYKSGSWDVTHKNEETLRIFLFYYRGWARVDIILRYNKAL